MGAWAGARSSKKFGRRRRRRSLSIAGVQCATAPATGRHRRDEASASSRGQGRRGAGALCRFGSSACRTRICRKGDGCHQINHGRGSKHTIAPCNAPLSTHTPSPFSTPPSRACTSPKTPRRVPSQGQHPLLELQHALLCPRCCHLLRRLLCLLTRRARHAPTQHTHAPRHDG